jgi:hypothetical protein
MKNALNWIIIIILILIFGSIPNSSAQYGMMYTEYGYNEKYHVVIDYRNTTQIIQRTEETIMELKKNNIDTVAIEAINENAREYEENDIPKAFQLAVKAWEMTQTATYSNYINLVNSEIINATSIGADTKQAVAKLEEAKRALSKGDYQNASLFTSDAYRLAQSSNVGFVSIKNLISSKEINVPKSKYDGHTVETGGLIRDIKSSGASYKFVIDDGNGVIAITYFGGLGDIKEGDSVYVKGVYYSQNINAESVTKGSGLVSGISSNIKVPGFEVILAISIIGVLWLRRKL